MLSRRTFLYSFVLFLSVSQYLLVSADEKPCTIHDGDKFYDLTPLKASKDYEFKSPGGHNWVINVCKPVNHETWHLPHPEDVAGYIRRDHGDFSIGVTNTTLSMANGHPSMTLLNGSPCTNAEHIKASTVFEFICDMSVFGAGKPELVAQLPPGNEADACEFVIEWSTHYACEAGEMGGHMGILAVLLVTLIIFLMLYTVAGTLYNRFALNRRGGDQIPEFSLAFFHALVRWLVDSTYHAFDGVVNRSRGHGVNPHSHQWSENARGTGRGRGRPAAERVPPTIIEEEEAMLGPEDDAPLEPTGVVPAVPPTRGPSNVPPANAHGRDEGAMDSEGVIRL